MCREDCGGEGELNMGGGGITPISETPREPRLSWLRSPLLWISWPLGVTLSLGSMESGLTASLTVKMRGWSQCFGQSWSCSSTNKTELNTTTFWPGWQDKSEINKLESNFEN